VSKFASKSKRKRTVPSDAKDPSRPWVRDGIDYGPAIGAVADLAAWAFELAARDVDDWPQAQHRVRSARKYVLDRLRGRHAHHVSGEDILFTAHLLARIFDADLSLSMTEMVSILDQLGLPTEVVPLRPRHQRSEGTATRVLPFRRARAEGTHSEPEPCAVCLSYPRFRNAA
jgi:hypothetical protein